jgi:hypothetical protein
MTALPAPFRLSQRPRGGVSCDETGLRVGDTQLLEKIGVSDPAWRPRRLEDLNDELSRAYGFPVDLAPKQRQLASIAKALTCGDLVLAQISALHLRLPDPPEADADRSDLVFRLAASGLLNKILWDESLHPRWPTGSPDSAGGQFAPAGEVGSTSAPADGTQAAPPASGASADQQRTLHFQTTIFDDDGTITGRFFINPASRTGGSVVQKVVSIDVSAGVAAKPVIGWEAWSVAPGAITSDNVQDDTWLAPQRGPPRPSVATTTTITAEARFYPGITQADLVMKYGFTKNGSDFSGELMSTKNDPNLPLDHASAPLTRSRKFIKW